MKMPETIFGEKKTMFAISADEIDTCMAELRKSIENDMFQNDRNEAKSVENAILKLHLK